MFTINTKDYLPGPDFFELWKETNHKNKGMRDKRMSLKEAVMLIPDGAHIALGGCQYSRTPIAMLKEIFQAGKKNLTVSRSIMSFEADFLFATGVMKKAITSWLSGAVTYGVSPIMRSMVESGRVEYEEWSHMGIGLRYRAAAMGVPFLPAKINLGSDLMKLAGIKVMNCPYTGEKLSLIPALVPDVAIIHAQKADKYGNVQLAGMPGMDPDLALAARTTIVTVEKIIPNDEIRRNAELTSIPFFAVDAVVEVPWGAFPHDCYGFYEPLYSHFTEYYEGMKASKDKEAYVKDYVQKYFIEPEDFVDYLQLFGVPAIVQNTKLGGL